MHRILYMLGEGLDRDKLNALLHDGTLALKLQENFHIFAAPVVLARWTQLGFDFSEPITADVAVNNSIFCGCTMQVVLKLLEWIAGQPLAPRVVPGSRVFAGLVHTRDGVSIPHATRLTEVRAYSTAVYSTPLHLHSFFLRAFASFSCA